MIKKDKERNTSLLLKIKIVLRIERRKRL